MDTRGFASDNNAGVHPEILKRLKDVNNGHVIGYGDDIYTEKAIKIIQDIFGEETEVFFVYNGTGANALSLKAFTNSFNSIICASTSHINVDECGAPEKFTGCKLIEVNTENGKLTCEGIKKHLHGFGFEHHSQPKIISLTQATELGTIYTFEELKDICDFAHENNMLVHMDGARLCNAAVGLDTTFKSITRDAGIDILSFGITKNGSMFGEAILFFHQKGTEDFKYYRKQGMQLHSKMRFIASQFITMLSGNLWKDNALHANKMAKLLENEIRKIPEVKITQKVETNAVFAIIPPKIIQPLQERYFFYVWDEFRSEVRWMTAFDTEEEDIYNFVNTLKELLQ